MIWYDMIWYDMLWYDMIWYDMIWYDMIWCDVMCYTTILNLLWSNHQKRWTLWHNTTFNHTWAKYYTTFHCITLHYMTQYTIFICYSNINKLLCINTSGSSKNSMNSPSIDCSEGEDGDEDRKTNKDKILMESREVEISSFACPYHACHTCTPNDIVRMLSNLLCVLVNYHLLRCKCLKRKFVKILYHIILHNIISHHIISLALLNNSTISFINPAHNTPI